MYTHFIAHHISFHITLHSTSHCIEKISTCDFEANDDRNFNIKILLIIKVKNYNSFLLKLNFFHIQSNQD